MSKLRTNTTKAVGQIRVSYQLFVSLPDGDGKYVKLRKKKVGGSSQAKLAQPFRMKNTKEYNAWFEISLLGFYLSKLIQH